jgi:hypothetical protein
MTSVAEDFLDSIRNQCGVGDEANAIAPNAVIPSAARIFPGQPPCSAERHLVRAP